MIGYETKKNFKIGAVFALIISIIQWYGLYNHWNQAVLGERYMLDSLAICAMFFFGWIFLLTAVVSVVRFLYHSVVFTKKKNELENSSTNPSESADPIMNEERHEIEAFNSETQEKEIILVTDEEEDEFWVESIMGLYDKSEERSAKMAEVIEGTLGTPEERQKKRDQFVSYYRRILHEDRINNASTKRNRARDEDDVIAVLKKALGEAATDATSGEETDSDVVDIFDSNSEDDNVLKF